jgi:hypothetical protein
MVAEPVQATVETLKSIYYRSAEFLTEQQGNITKKIEKLTASIPEPIPLITKEQTTWDKLTRHVDENKLYYGVGLGLFTGSLLYYNVHRHLNVARAQYKRRVPKLSNGARRDVVLVVGSPTEPLTRLICLDFEKRGFIVYLTLLDDKDIKYVESNPITDDLNYLNLKSSDKSGTTNNLESQLSKFNQLLRLPVIPFPGAESHSLKLKSVVFAPSLYFPIGPIENVSINAWGKINERFNFYLMMLSCGLIQIIRNQQAKTILIYSNIVSGLNMPFHGPETIFNTQLKTLFTTLTRELKPLNLCVTQVKLGNIHISNQAKSSELKISNIINSELSSWNDDVKSLYGKAFSRSQSQSNPIRDTGGKGTSLKEFYHVLFDLIYSKKRNPPVVYCGTGARAYDLVGRMVPDTWLERFVS